MLYQKFIPFYVGVKTLQIIHPPVDGHSDCLLFSPFMTKAVINIILKLLKLMLSLWRQKKFFIVTSNYFLVLYFALIFFVIKIQQFKKVKISEVADKL